MSKFFLLSTLFILYSLNCKSQTANDSIPIGTIVADLDGVHRSFSMNAVAILSLDSNMKGYVVYGAADTSKYSDFLAVSVLAMDTTIGVGKYNKPYYDTVSKILITTSIEYTQPKKKFVVYASTDAVEVIITSIEDGVIQGTFRGKLNGNKKPLSISDGRFKVRMIKEPL
jgi:hypothetical protein